ncbi:hypothetical protein AAG068_27855 (plasmid) [Bacillus paramycoides]|uniref:hypothetical protein n=1 Tax=Bacillus cereus group TaxID=86661 RepID=UPI000BFD37DE|nr:hypothetical protein [Bacillus thuringiensis]KAB2364585.1 hypothetical protein F8517_23910 [Bacillus thuringiensis]PGT62888.1 hypothetical protein COD16_08550 [Bacillus thuringiensis]
MNDSSQTKKEVYEMMLHKAKTDKEFFTKLAHEPEKIISELNITDPKVKERILLMTPEKLFEGLNSSDCVVLTTVVSGSCN